RHALSRAAAELGHGGRRVDVMPYEPALAAKAGRARVRTDRREMAVVLRRVLERAETTHGESRHGATVVLGVGPEVGVDPRDQLVDVEVLPVTWPHVAGDRVAVPPRGPAVGHDDDEWPARRHGAD